MPHGYSAPVGSKGTVSLPSFSQDTAEPWDSCSAMLLTRNVLVISSVGFRVHSLAV